MRFISAAILASSTLLCPVAQAALEMRVSDAWIRWLPENLPWAGYMTLINEGSVAEVLVGASSPDFGEITLHQSRNVQGLSSMVSLTSVTVGPNSSVDFAAMGYHLMLTRARRPFHSGERVAVTLCFANRHSMLTSFEVRAAAAN